MKTRLWILIMLLANHAIAQGIFERLDITPQKGAAILLAYTNTESNGINATAFSTAGIYYCTIQTNPAVKLACIVTAGHSLKDKATGSLYDGVIVKINSKLTGKPTYIRLPIKKDPPSNVWWSEMGYDLAVIPLPWDVLSDIDPLVFSTEQIVTAENAKEEDIRAGLLAQVLCFQPEYLDPLDWIVPEVFPIIRLGHIARMGFYTSPDGNTICRPHVIDIHSSPGNSGALVIVWVPATDMSVSKPHLLGIVQGFNEEIGSYQEYKATVTSETADASSLLLVNTATHTTNAVALSFKTVANPNLTYVTPIYELTTLPSSTSFLMAAAMMIQNRNLYERYETIPAALGTK